MGWSPLRSPGWGLASCFAMKVDRPPLPAAVSERRLPRAGHPAVLLCNRRGSYNHADEQRRWGAAGGSLGDPLTMPPRCLPAVVVLFHRSLPAVAVLFSRSLLVGQTGAQPITGLIDNAIGSGSTSSWRVGPAQRLDRNRPQTGLKQASNRPQTTDR